MKKVYLFILLAFTLSGVSAQKTSDYVVQVHAQVKANPPSITLQWAPDDSVTTYAIYRKAKTAKIFPGIPSKVFSSGATGITTWTDTGVKVGVEYEYKIYKAVTRHYTVAAYGYISAGINIPPVNFRGKMILLVDSAFATSLSSEIERLKWDLRGDGWVLLTHVVGRNEKVEDVKKIITSLYLSDKTNVNALFLLGHIPVPYSGDLNPDAHPDHLGAWPADVFYGDIDGIWTDQSVNNAASSSKNNVPGDGIYDQNLLPSDVELQVGRVDMYNMPAMGKTENELMRRYLNKDHDFRTRAFVAKEEALVDDNFGIFNGEAFAASGYRNFAPMIGDSGISAGDLLQSSINKTWLLGYACGGGTYQSAAGVGTTDSFAADSSRIVFNMMFGSYFGDWNTRDNFLKAPLAGKGMALTSCWSGRPYWEMHHMALGENIGYSARLTQNNLATYYYSYAGNGIHIALMGDPSLRLHTIKPPSKLKLQPKQSDTSVSLKWNASKDKVLGYRIYRAHSLNDSFHFVGNTSGDTFFIDQSPGNGNNIYMVRAMTLQKSGSGTYYNQSEGAFDSTSIISTGIADIKIQPFDFEIYPNPSTGKFYILLPENKNVKISVADALGRSIYSKNISGQQISQIDLTGQAKGIYFISIANTHSTVVKKFIIE